MKLKINILKSSIKQNPNAGSTVFYSDHRVQITGIYKGRLPKRYAEKVLITSQQFFLDKPIESEFILTCKKIPKALLNDKKVKELNYERLSSPIYSNTPEPKYFYKYENRHIPCSDCGKKTPFKKIEEDWINDEHHVYICPHCGSTDGYPEFEFQRIEEVV